MMRDAQYTRCCLQVSLLRPMLHVARSPALLLSPTRVVGFPLRARCLPTADGHNRHSLPLIGKGSNQRSNRCYWLLCFFLVRLTVSLLSTCNRVCELSRIFMYA